MAVPPRCSLLHHRFLTGDKPVLTLDDEFLRNHTKVLLISDASEKIWKVKLNGSKLAGGWEEFAAVHSFRDGDVLVFRNDGDEIFHVAASPRSDSCYIRHRASPSFVDTDDSETDEDYSESDDEEEECDDDDAGDILVNKNKTTEAGFSCFLRARVTPYSLIKDRLDLSKDFTVVSFNKPCEIDLVNENGRRWTLLLSKNTSSGVFYIRRGWVNFCSANGLGQGDICKFKLSENGERPVLTLCSSSNNPEADAVRTSSVGGCTKEKRTLDEASKGKKKKKNNSSKFLTIKLTPNRLETGQLYISSVFVNESGIKKSGEITLMNQDGRKWLSYLQMTGQCGSEWFYLRHGWREMCRANGVKVNDSFVLELIWEGGNLVFKFCSKVDNKGNGNGRPCKKRAHEAPIVETERRKRGRPRLSNRHAAISSNLRRTQQESCSVSDQVSKVKLSILDTLNTVRQFRAELEAREKNLEASLLEVDGLGRGYWESAKSSHQ